jgi:hypothetical protein
MAGPNVTITLDKLEQALPPDENVAQYQHNVQGPYYNQKVAPKLERRPWLDVLHNFLDPNEKHFAVATNRRLSTFDVQVIHISASGEVNKPINCNGVSGEADFQRAISNVDKELCGTLIIAEDLSSAMINALGMQYDLEPEFFAYHLDGTQSFRMGEWQSQTVRGSIVLPDHLRKAPHYTMSFRRPYHIPGGLDKIIELRSTKTNTPRGAQVLRRDIPDAFVFEKISVYKRKGSSFGMLHRKIISDTTTLDKANMLRIV